MRQISAVFFTVLALTLADQGQPCNGAEVPNGLVLDIRVIEARSASPDFQTMEALSFFIDTDGSDVTEFEWLATIAPKVPDSVLASLAFETLSAPDGEVSFELTKRSQKIVTDVGLAGFLERGTFEAPLTVRLERRDSVEREFQKEIELRLGQTYVFSGRGLELSASEYLSHLRDYESSDNRTELYRRLRDSTVFLIMALTPRIESPVERVTLQLPDDVEIRKLESPYDITLVGSIVLYFDVDSAGVPQNIAIARSSLPEVNPLILGDASSWRFPQAAGEKARLLLELRAEPDYRP